MLYPRQRLPTFCTIAHAKASSLSVRFSRANTPQQKRFLTLGYYPGLGTQRVHLLTNHQAENRFLWLLLRIQNPSYSIVTLSKKCQFFPVDKWVSRAQVLQKCSCQASLNKRSSASYLPFMWLNINNNPVQGADACTQLVHCLWKRQKLQLLFLSSKSLQQLQLCSKTQEKVGLS